TCPGRIRSGFPMWFSATRRATVVPKRAAMALRVSPRRTTTEGPAASAGPGSIGPPSSTRANAPALVATAPRRTRIVFLLPSAGSRPPIRREPVRAPSVWAVQQSRIDAPYDPRHGQRYEGRGCWYLRTGSVRSGEVNPLAGRAYQGRVL